MNLWSIIGEVILTVPLCSYNATHWGIFHNKAIQYTLWSNTIQCISPLCSYNTTHWIVFHHKAFQYTQWWNTIQYTSLLCSYNATHWVSPVASAWCVLVFSAGLYSTLCMVPYYPVGSRHWWKRRVKGSGSLWVTIIIITNIIILTIIIKLEDLLSSEHICYLWVTHVQSWILIVAHTDLPHMVGLSILLLKLHQM